MSETRVMVAGGGVGGLSTAVGLCRRGTPVVLYERAPAIQELGTGVGIQRVALQALELLGLGDVVRQIGGDPLQELRLLSQDGRLMATIPRRGEAVVVDRGQLVELLRRELEQHNVIVCDAQLVGFNQDSDGVTARFADGREERGATLVGADGVRSVVREQLLGDGPPLDSGWTAWRGMPAYRHPTLPRDVSEQVWGPAGLFGLFPCGERMFWWGGSFRARRVPHSPTAHKRELLDTFGSWPEGIRELVSATPEDQIFGGEIYHRLPVKSWTTGRVTLLGDAAHPTMPAFGQGAGMAIEDGAVLARELSAAADLRDAASVGAALRAYEQRRIPRTTEIVNRARRMARICTWRSPVAIKARELLVSAVPERQWLRTYEHEHAYQL
jgi:2-polyprenyl-6-methoxyphenol hydroxylase-like FAD-dependent oxidoreductase